MSAGVLFVVWQGGEKAVSGAMTVGAFIAYLELYLRFVNRGFRVPQMINSIQGGAAAYARLRPPGSSPTARQRTTWGLLPCRPYRWHAGASACTTHRSHRTGSGLTARGHLPLLDCHCSSVTTSGWTFRLAPWSRSQDPLVRAKAPWPGPCWACIP